MHRGFVKGYRMVARSAEQDMEWLLGMQRCVKGRLRVHRGV